MKQLMIVSHDTYAQGLTPASSDLDDLASLAEGAWAMIDKEVGSATFDQVVSIAATSEAETPAYFMLAVMTANGLKLSPVITKANATCTYLAYNAPVAKVMNIAHVISSIEVGDVFGFVVTDLTKPAHELSRNRSYTYTAVAGAVEATVNAALIAAVNADPLGIVTASAGTDIVLTGDTAGAGFTVSPIGRCSESTITITTPLEVGFGTAAQLVEYEKECNVFRGNANYPQYQDLNFTLVSEVNTTTPGTYNCYMVKHRVPNKRDLIRPDENNQQEILIAALASLTGSGDGKSVEGLTNFDADLGAE